MKRKLISTFLLFLAVLIGFTTGSSAWFMNESVESDVNIDINKVPVQGYVENYRSGQNTPYARFSHLEGAVNNANAQSGNIKVVVTYGSVLDVTSSFTINSNVNVILPYSDANHNYREDAIGPNQFADRTTAQVNTNRKVLVRVHNSIITIAYGGTLSVGGKTGLMGPAEGYAEINLNPYSSIEVYGTLNVYGYIKESDARHGNLPKYQNIYDNSFDANRFIKVKNNGIIDTALGIYNVTSGAILTNLNDLGILPINIFQFPGIQTYLTIEYGGTFSVQVKITVATFDQRATSTIVSAHGKAPYALFFINSGSISFEYCPTVVGLTNYDRSPTRIITDGNIDVGYLHISAGATISTQNIHLPISFKLQIIINTGSLSTSYKIKFMPGSSLRVNNNAVINNNSEVIFYKEDYSLDVKNPIYPTSGYADARLINNGRINMSANAKLGAYIETERTDNGAILDLTEVTNQTNLTASSIEGQNSRLISVTTNGTFYDVNTDTYSISQFKAGNTITSLNEAWVGEKYDLVMLDIIFDYSDGFLTNVGSYTIATMQTLNATPVNLTSGETTISESYPVITNYYVQIKLTRVANATLNGDLIPTATYVFQITGDATIVVRPLEGIKVQIAGSSVSGNGDVKYKFTENYNSTNYVINIGYEDIVTIIKGATFKVERTGNTRNPKPTYLKQADAIPATQPTTGDPEFQFNNFFHADAYYRIFVTQDAQSICVTPETLVTMADGSYKEAQDIRAGDMVMAMNHEKGIIEPTVIIINDHLALPADNNVILNLHFSNGKVVGVIGDHGFFDIALNQYVYIDQYNYEDYIGHRFYGVKSNTDLTREDVTLERVELEERFTKVYSPVSFGFFNIITADVLSMPGAIPGLFNYFDYDPDTLAWDKDQMAADIALYGLLNYDDFKDYISYEIYLAINAQYLSVAMGKGLLTWEMFIKYANLHAGNIEI